MRVYDSEGQGEMEGEEEEEEFGGLGCVDRMTRELGEGGCLGENEGEGYVSTLFTDLRSGSVGRQQAAMGSLGQLVSGAVDRLPSSFFGELVEVVRDRFVAADAKYGVLDFVVKVVARDGEWAHVFAASGLHEAVMEQCGGTLSFWRVFPVLSVLAHRSPLAFQYLRSTDFLKTLVNQFAGETSSFGRVSNLTAIADFISSPFFLFQTSETEDEAVGLRDLAFDLVVNNEESAQIIQAVRITTTLFHKGGSVIGSLLESEILLFIVTLFNPSNEELCAVISTLLFRATYVTEGACEQLRRTGFPGFVGQVYAGWTDFIEVFYFSDLLQAVYNCLVNGMDSILEVSEESCFQEMIGRALKTGNSGTRRAALMVSSLVVAHVGRSSKRRALGFARGAEILESVKAFLRLGPCKTSMYAAIIILLLYDAEDEGNEFSEALFDEGVQEVLVSLEEGEDGVLRGLAVEARGWAEGRTVGPTRVRVARTKEDEGMYGFS